MKTTNTQSAKSSLRDANKETKTLSGAIKIARLFWSKGYKRAFSEFGLTFDDMKLPVIVDMLQKDEEGNIYVTRKVAMKNKEGEYIYKMNGEKMYEMQDKVVKAWTVNTLFLCLEQSQTKKNNE
jgi:hypothetical protein